MATSSESTESAVIEPSLSIRMYDAEKDATRVEVLERQCEAGGPSRSATLFTDLLGDPLCRVRNFPAYSMLVAELQILGAPEIVGIIRAGIKEVVRSFGEGDTGPKHVCTAYISGLRVSPQYRRQGIAAELVKRMERWCRDNGAEYAYIATDKSNDAAVRLFTTKLGYKKFRTPTILVHPVNRRRKKTMSSKVKVKEMSRESAEALYRMIFKDMEFFPKDIGEIMRSRLNRGTWMAMWEDRSGVKEGKECWAVVSMWRCNEIFKLKVKGVGAGGLILSKVWRFLARALPFWIPAPPDIFRLFGLQLAYGLHAGIGGGGSEKGAVVRELMRFAQNVAAEEGCELVACELGGMDPLRRLVPSWGCLSCEEDLLCIKSLSGGGGCQDLDWSEVVAQPPSLFVDPRDF